MTTKAEAMAAVEAAAKAVAKAAEVVSALTEVDTKPPPVQQAVSVVDAGNGQLKITTVGIDTVRWVHTDGLTGKWYGNITPIPVPPEGVVITPRYAKASDRVRVMWGGATGMDKGIPGPVYTPDTAPQPPVEPPPKPVEPQPTNDARFRFVSVMTVGTNQERLNMVGLTYSGTSLRKERSYYDYLNGFSTWDRYFSPVNFTMDRGCGTSVPGLWACDQLLDCAQQSIMARRRTVYSPLDVMDKAEFARWGEIKTWFTMAVKRVAERAMDPEWFAFELANEWATDDAVLCNRLQKELYVIARQYLPNHRIVVGGPEWNGVKRFDAQWEPMPDNDYIIQFHHYEMRSDWTSLANTMLAFGAKHNVPIINGELNIDFGRMKQGEHAKLWAENFLAFARTGKRIPFNPWAFIGGKQDFRLNVGPTDPRAIPLMESTFKQCHTLMTAV